MEALKEKTALVTGVGRRRGIGYALCSELSNLGANIFYTYWREYDQDGKLVGSDENPAEFAGDFNQLGNTVGCMELDLRTIHAPRALFDAAVAQCGIPDILINNACFSTNQPFNAVTAEILDEHYAVNVRATTLLCKEFVTRFQKQTGGKIVNLTSGQSLGVMPGELPYAITKAAVEMLTLQLELALRDSGITINAVDPGPTDTGWMSEEVKKLIAGDPMGGRISTPQEAAALVLSFIHGEREAVTGSVLHANRA